MTIELAQKLFRNARAHGVAAEQLYQRAYQDGLDHQPDDPAGFAFNCSHSLSFNYLACLSLELYLKAVIAALGNIPNDKPLRDIGHDLVRAHETAEELGFQSQVANLDELVGLLREPFCNHFFRYNTPEEMMLPEFEGIHGMLKLVDEDVRGVVGPTDEE